MTTVPATTAVNGESQADGFSIPWAVVLLVGVLTVGTVAVLKSIYKPLWFDEFFTLMIARMQTPGDVLRALRQPFDVMPPLYYLICRAGLMLVPDPHVGIRLPSVCGFLITISGVYAFLSRRVDRLSALTGSGFVACSALADYAYEGRPYALLTGSVCLAACAWQRLDRSQAWAVVMACMLGASVSCHYYAVFIWPAFVLAEALVTASERRCRPWAWLAMAIGVVPFFVCWPLLANFRIAAGPHWWAPPRLSLVLSVPQVLFKLTGGMWGPALAAALASVLLLWIVRSPPFRMLPASLGLPSSPLTLGECGLAVGLLALPVVEVVATRIAGGGMTERYAMPLIIGAAFAIGALTGIIPPVFRAIALSVMLVNYAIVARPVFATWAQGGLFDARMAIGRQCEEFIVDQAKQGLPIVISSGQYYLQLATYASPETRSLMRSLADPSSAVEFSAEKSNVIDRSILGTRNYFPVQVDAYDDFLAAHASFILVSNGDPSEWLPAKLVHDGHALTILPTSGGVRTYEVTVRNR